MLRGQGGLASGGIYFATCQADTDRKAHQRGVVLVCRVHLGRVKTISASGDQSITCTSLEREGYNSVLIPRQNGIEYVVYNWDQVLDIEQHYPPPSVHQKIKARRRQMMILRFAAFLKHPLLKKMVQWSILICLLLAIGCGWNFVIDTRDVRERARDAMTLAQTRLHSQDLSGAKDALNTIPQEYTGDKTWIRELNNLNQAIETGWLAAARKERKEKKAQEAEMKKKRA